MTTCRDIPKPLPTGRIHIRADDKPEDARMRLKIEDLHYGKEVRKPAAREVAR